MLLENFIETLSSSLADRVVSPQNWLLQLIA